MFTCKSSVQKFFQFWLLFSPWLHVFQWVPVDRVEVLLFPSVRCPVASLSFFLRGSWYISVLQLLVICPFSIVFCSWCGVPCFLLANNWRFLVFIRALGRLKTCPHSAIVPSILRWSRALSCSEGWNVGETPVPSSSWDWWRCVSLFCSRATLSLERKPAISPLYVGLWHNFPWAYLSWFLDSYLYVLEGFSSCQLVSDAL